MKLSFLTQQDKIKLAAELDGKGDWNIQMLLDEHKNYSTSYDAIIPLIQKQSRPVKIQIIYKVKQMFNIELYTDAKASQLLDALLVATETVTL